MRLYLVQKRVSGTSRGSRKKRAELGCLVFKDMSAEFMKSFNIRTRRPSEL